MQLYFNVRVKTSSGVQALSVEDRSERFFQAVRGFSDEDLLLAASRRPRRTHAQAVSDPLVSVSMAWTDPEQRARLERLMNPAEGLQPVMGSYSALAGAIFNG